MRKVALGLFFSLAAASSAAFAAGVDPGVATPVQREQAQNRFMRGRQLYEAGKYEASAKEFRASNDIVASPNARLYLARSLRELGRYVEAYVELGRTEVEAKEHAKDDGRYVKAAEAAAVERKALTPKLGFLSVHVTHAREHTTLRVGGDEVRRAAWGEPAPVMPGSTQVVLEEPLRPPVTQSWKVAAGETKSVTIDAGEAESPSPLAAETARSASTSTGAADRSSLRPYAYVAGGIGAAGLVTFVIAGILANGTYSDLQAQCGAGPCPGSFASEVSRGKTEQTVANVGLVVGILGAGAGVTLYVLSMPKSSATASFVASPSWSGVRGTF